jgi:PAS domain S-box-containing protein
VSGPRSPGDPPPLADDQIRAFLDAAPDAMLITNRSGTIVFVNAQAQSLFGYAPAQLIGRDVDVLLPERFRDGHAGYRHAYFESPRARPMGAGVELYALRRDGTEFPAEISLSPVRTERGLFVASAIRDVSERKAVENQLLAAREEAERANRSKSAFLAAASHDLRQPVQALSLLNSVFARTVPDSSKAADALANQARILEVMSDLLGSLLDVSKLEAGAIEPNVEDCAVREIFESLGAEFVEAAAAKDLTLSIEESGEVVRTDGDLLTRIIQNLLANAIRYTARGRVELRAAAGASNVRIEVVDTGIGIPLSELDKIFDDFYRVPGVRMRRDGFGLGLSVVRRLSELLGHPLEVDSTYGAGTRFVVRVPKGNAARAGSPPPQRATDAQAAAASVIVIIDDDDSVADATALLLDVVGYQVVVAPDLERAQARLRELGVEPDLLICDFHLQGPGNGIDAIRALRRTYRCPLPAIVVSGDTSSAMGVNAAQVEHCRLMRKPVDSDALLAAISELAAG